ncbi:MAG: BTAD domain-containing putative transcriptional regulator [Vulcanimicrobiaceae bacterium]
MVISQAPRMGPTVIRRPRLEDWFSRFENVPVRFVVAPAGSGKTTAILGYLRHSETAGLYCSLGDGTTAADVRTAIARALQWDIECVSHDDIIRALVECAPVELALDRADSPDPDGIAEILRLIEELPDGVSLLIACRSRSAIDVGHFVARGVATLCDTERLAFDAAEIRHLAETCGVSFTHTDIVKILEASDGWPIVVSSAIRKAAEDGRNLADAFERWRSRQGHLFTEFVTTALEGAREEDAALVRALMAGTPCEDQQRLSALEIEGLFVVHGEYGYQPFRAITRLRSYRVKPSADTASVTPMQVRMFGRFQAEIDGHPIEWIRRRDAQIFKYIALKRSGTVTRAELAETFWPGAERHLVAQSVRTAFCNIRKAIASIVGFDAVDAYFRASSDISIDLDNVIIDVNRFLAHANDGDQQYERNDLRAAYAHYRTADQLYWGHLLIGDAAEQWFATQAAMLEDRHVMILEQLSDIARELSDHGAAISYARRVVEMRPGSESAHSVLAMVSRQARLHNLTTIETRRAEPGAETMVALAARA